MIRHLSLFSATLFVSSFLLSSPGSSQEHNPYTSLQDREIRALSQAEMEGLLEGAGLGMALTAELNGVPGPLHVLELATELELTPEQRDATERLFDRMNARAREIGQEVLDSEAELERRFRHQHMDPETLAELGRRIGVLRGDLRVTHLQAHLDMLPILTPDQVEQYLDLRGYDALGVDDQEMDHGHHPHL